ncbi:MAG TPA: SufD family Fe-S cluster assembly protein [Solirubrobacteraceae bacterium]|jgi:Fe-S cluster assembly protein SufD|nr:SufD family Fe-S cluster assembly protein [Solirubrobacteraceae bacterium]
MSAANGSATAGVEVSDDVTGAGEGVVVKPGRHREASLYHALAGAGDGDGRTLAQLREAALRAFEDSELPVWRRSGFWTTSFAELDEGLLVPRETTPNPHDGNVPEFVTSAIPERPRAGRIVQLDASVVHVELDRRLAEQGVILCSLEQAAELHGELFARWYSKRLTIDRHKLEAANAAFWTGGAFLHVPEGVIVEDPFEIVYAISGPGVAQYGRTLVIGGRSSEFRVHEHDLAADFAEPDVAEDATRDSEDGVGRPEGHTQRAHGKQSLHAGAFEMYLQDGARCRLAQVQDWGSGDVFDSSTRFVGVGRDAYCHWLPALLGGHLVRHHFELAVMEPGGDMAFRGLFFTEAQEHLDTFAVDLHETGPSGGDVHWRGAATGQSRASFEGLIQIDPGAQKTHTYLQIHTLMLSPKARLDAIPSVLVSADDVSASHGGTVGELDEASIFYMASRGLDRPSAVRLLVEGFFEPVLGQLEDEPLEELVRTKVASKLARAKDDIEAYATAR